MMIYYGNYILYKTMVVYFINYILNIIYLNINGEDLRLNITDTTSPMYYHFEVVQGLM